MGTSFIGALQAAQCFRIILSEANLLLMENVPFSKSELQRCAKSHVLFAGYPIAIAHMQTKYPHLFAVKEKDWYESELPALANIDLGWYLLRKKPLAKSSFKTWDEQVHQIPTRNFAPTVCEIAFACALFYSVHKIRLFKDVYIRTTDKKDGGRHAIGDFDESGMGIISVGDDNRASDVRLTTIRRKLVPSAV